jgi:hypothetical protein
MFFRGANSIEGSWFFGKKNFVADSNEIAVSFLRIFLKRKNRGKIFSAQKKRIEKRNPAV